ncbi:phosphoglycerate kinase [Candidatus Woesearchaeota archaeon]|nr:phosphoglycerate kinase [Candidatus Woesearchaeota archaeon]
MYHFTLPTFPLAGKSVLVRVDYNVPLHKGKVAGVKRKQLENEVTLVADTRRILATLPTLRYLLEKNCKIILATHIGRPEGKIVPELSTRLLVPALQELFPRRKIVWLNDCIGEEVRKKISEGSSKEIFLLENLRFYKEEEKNNAFFAHALAHLAEVCVNDAFAVSHREHASVHALTKYLPSVAGFLLEKELGELSKALHPKKPAVWIMGGAKLNKLSLMLQAFKKADRILVGGALAFAFLKARGFSTGMSKTDRDSVRQAKRILKKSFSRKIVLPKDFVVADTFSSTAKTHIVPANNIQTNQVGLDIGPETITLFEKYLRQAKTIVWNGPLGYYEWVKFAGATKAIGKFMGTLDSTYVTSIAGGGETAEALEKFHLVHNFTHVSTGGGAALEFLSGEKLPGITALEKNFRRWSGKVKIKS